MKKFYSLLSSFLIATILVGCDENIEKFQAEMRVYEFGTSTIKYVFRDEVSEYESSANEMKATRLLPYNKPQYYCDLDGNLYKMHHVWREDLKKATRLSYSCIYTVIKSNK